ncbi:mRNA export factor-like [Varroa jacobsoni]|uniref:mRNA export factor n=1 Tax=Varroa destructor TaxID=109461 RepID=A0A7M7MBS2_VARDE|nr:mRNA export factor-like [Varroa destructor]XP_022701190.1 mRNA export factor-like [Varroa jacobsoni]
MFTANNAQNASFGFGGAPANHNPMKDFEVVSPPDDTIAGLAFSPASLTQNFLVSGSWDNQLRCWEVHQNGQSVPKAQQSHQGPVLDIAWSDDGSKVFSASADKTVKMWDLNANQLVQVAAHDNAVKTVHWINAGNYQCIMTGSWDKTVKFWDTRSSSPIMSIQMQERVYCADVLYPMAVVSTAGRGIFMYSLENTPRELKSIESPLKYQHRCVSVFVDKQKNQPTGFGLGSVEGRVAIQYVQPVNPKDNFTFKCHRSNSTNASGYQDIYPVNDIAFHPQHGTLATVGSDGKFSYWDKDARTKLKTSEQMDNSITRCCFNARGEIFAYAVGYDWSKGHEAANPQKKNYIFLHPCFEELKPRSANKK